MADRLKMDPARIERLRDPSRLEQVNPERILDLVTPSGAGSIVDVGAGVGFVSLPLARRLPQARVIACDLLPGMLELLARAAGEQRSSNIDTALMSDPVTLPLEDHSAGLLVMLQVHHELDDAVALLRDCRRVLMPGAHIVVVDWKDEDLPGMPKGGRRVPRGEIERDLVESGFHDVSSHDLYALHCTVTGVAPKQP